jgi:hypothetical protein
MDFLGLILKGLVGIAAIMTGVYLLATYGGTVNANAIPLFLMPIGVAMFMANPPARKGLAATGLTGIIIILIAGSTTIGWVLLLTIPPAVGYSVGVRAFREWDLKGGESE